MEDLLHKLLSGKNMALDTQELNNAMVNNNGAYELIYLVRNSNETSIRQYAAILLRKHFAIQENWQQYDIQQQTHFKDSTLQATFLENSTVIICPLARTLAKMLQRSGSIWRAEVFNVLWDNLNSADPNIIEKASLVFAILTEHEPELFIPHVKKMCLLNQATVSAAEKNTDRVTKTTLNIFKGISKMVCYMPERKAIEIFQSALPVLFTMLNVFSKGIEDNDSDNLGITFDIFEDFTACVPQILTPHLKRLVEFCLNTSFNSELTDGIRSRTIHALCWVLEENKNAMAYMNLVLPTVKSIFDLIVKCAKEEIENFSVMDDDDNSTISAACDTMDMFANTISSEDMYPMLIELIKDATQSEEEGLRRAALIVMAITVEGFASIIKRSNHEAYWVNIIKNGVFDPSVYVRCAAFFALGQCTEHMKPEIIKYSEDIMPVFLQFLNARCNGSKSETERKYVGLIFFALNYFCECMEYNDLEPYLPSLMSKLFECASPCIDAIDFRQMAFESMRVIIRKSGEKILPYMGAIITLLQPYLGEYCEKLEKSMRVNAIATLEDLATAVGRDNFEPLFNDSVQLILMLSDILRDEEDDLTILMSFTTAMTSLYSDKAGVFMHKIIDCIFNVGLTHNVPTFDSDNKEIDYEDYSDDENGADAVINQLFCESMITLLNFCKCCTLEFRPYLKPSFEKCFILISHHSEIVRENSIGNCSEFLEEFIKYEHDNMTEIIHLFHKFASKLIDIINTEKKMGVGVVIVNALENYITTSSCLEKLDERFIKAIVDIIISGLKDELSFQVEFYEDNGDKLYDLALKTAISSLLCVLSTNINREEFLVCFEKICPVLLEGLECADGDHEWLEDRNAISIYCMGSCITALGEYSAKYYNVIFNLMYNGIRSESVHIQNDAMRGLGELILQAGPCSYDSFPHILKELSRLKQENNSENIEMVCVTLAHLILANRTLVPITEVLPIIIMNAPLKEHTQDNITLFGSLKLIYVEEREIFLQYFNEIVARCLHLIDNVMKNIIPNGCQTTALELVHELRNTYREQFQMILGENEDFNSIIYCE